MRRLRVLSEHPHIGKPGEVRDGFEGAQAYIDAGLAEWVVDRAEPVETAMREGAPEAAARAAGRRSSRRASGPGGRPAEEVGPPVRLPSGSVKKSQP